MATDFIKKLDKLVADSGGDWKVFIRKLGPVHAQWHVEHNQGVATLGFLIFHWELIQRFKKSGADVGLGGLHGIHAYTEAQFSSFGQPYNVTETVSHGDVNAFEIFSGDVEAWHNDAHMAVGMATHHDLMNPRTNVRRPEFWRLHYFINHKFDEQLKHFSSSGATPADAIKQLEGNAAAAASI
jgi:hypothetical protein